MNIQPPQNNNGPAYPSRAGIAALAAACMLGTIPSVFSAEPRGIPQGTLPVSSDASQSAASEAFDREWSREVRGQNLYVKQQVEQDALLGAYANGKTPVPDETMARLQEMILNHARQRQDIRKNPEDKNGDGAMRWAYAKGEIAVEPGKSHQKSYEEWSMLQRQYREEERLLGKYMNAAEAMPKEKLVEVKDLLLKHIRERKAMREQFAPKQQSPSVAD